MTSAVLRGADLSNAILVGANLSEAIITGANLTGTDLEDADISTAIYRYEDLVGVVKNLDRAIRNTLRIDPRFEELCNTIKNIGGSNIRHVAILDNRRKAVYESKNGNKSDLETIMKEMGWIHWQVKKRTWAIKWNPWKASWKP